MILIRIENRREGIKKKKRDRRRFEQFRLCVGDFKLSVVPSVSKDIFFHGGNICEGSRAWNFNTPPPDVWNFNISSGRKSWAFRGLIIALISHSWFCCYKYSNRFTPRKRFHRITGGNWLDFQLRGFLFRESYAKLRIENREYPIFSPARARFLTFLGATDQEVEASRIRPRLSTMSRGKEKFRLFAKFNIRDIVESDPFLVTVRRREKSRRRFKMCVSVFEKNNSRNS